jgi:hypothetical protein
VHEAQFCILYPYVSSGIVQGIQKSCEGGLGASLQQAQILWGVVGAVNRWKEDKKQLKLLKYRCKVKHAKLYEQMSTIHNTYMDVWNLLRDIYHDMHSNKSESLNGFIIKFLRKHNHNCWTIVNQARIYLAVEIDFLGYDKYYCVIWKMLGLASTAINDWTGDAGISQNVTSLKR